MELQELIKKVPAYYDWLIKSDHESGRYFANIIHQRYAAWVGVEPTRGMTYPAWGDTPEGALNKALIEYFNDQQVANSQQI